MLSKFLAAALLVACSYGSTWRDEFTKEDLKEVGSFKNFKEWQNEYDRIYETIEVESAKFKTWLDNLKIIADYNSRDLTYKLKLNQFGDMTSDEFKLYVHGNDGACFKRNELFDFENIIVSKENNKMPVNAPESVDWRTKGVVTPVKNQGQCGSCWAFSATGAMECDYAIKTGDLNSLSEQELVDCCHLAGSAGCNGGQMYAAMEWAAENGGLCSEEEYPYKARDGTCESSKCGTKYDKPSGKGYTPVTKDSETAMVTATVAGCVSVGIEADQTAFQHYSSGVLTGTCGTRIDHGVLIVGYGTETGTDYWLVKNSWGVTWGERGYVKICRNCNKNGNAGECGILKEGNVPIY